MKQKLSIFALFLALLAPLGLLATTASAQTRGVGSGGGPAGAGGRLDITIETFGTLIGIQSSCAIAGYTITIPIPTGALCNTMTDAIYDSLTANVSAYFEITKDPDHCIVYLRRSGDPECTYFELKVRGDWAGMTFTVLDAPTPSAVTTWGYLKTNEWRRALRGEVAEKPRR